MWDSGAADAHVSHVVLEGIGHVRLTLSGVLHVVQRRKENKRRDGTHDLLTVRTVLEHCR
jgi:hypothetical protein